jgi:hypothetical protein
MESALDALKDRRQAIVGRWMELALEIYPQRTSAFLTRERDRFQNPVGHALAEGLGVLYDGLVAGGSAEERQQALDAIVRIRAVQDMPASQAVGFVFLLKRALREIPGAVDADRLSELHERIDRLALEAFDLFVRCREKIYDLRVREIRARASTLIERRQARDAERSPTRS